MRILIAEDDNVSRRILEKRLTGWGFEVISTTDGKSAWDIMSKKNPPKLAIIDWMMPKMDGVDLCTHIRKQNTNFQPYLILLTAKIQNEDIVKGLNAGANDYIAKPFILNELKARLHVGKRMVVLQEKLFEKISELHIAKNEIRRLKDFIPICSYCKKIRDESDHWHEIEHYINHETGSKFSHGICPDCMEKL